MANDPLEEALQRHDRERAVRRSHEQAAAAEASTFAQPKAESIGIFRSFASRMPPTTTRPLLRIDTEDVLEPLGGGRRRSRKQLMTTRKKFSEHQVGDGWPLMKLGYLVSFGSNKFDEDDRARYTLIIDRHATPYLGLVDPSGIVVEGNWRRGKSESWEAGVEIGRPLGPDFEAATIRLLQMKGPVEAGYLQDFPSAPPLRQFTYGAVPFVELVTDAMAHELRKASDQ